MEEVGGRSGWKKWVEEEEEARVQMKRTAEINCCTWRNNLNRRRRAALPNPIELNLIKCQEQKRNQNQRHHLTAGPSPAISLLHFQLLASASWRDALGCFGMLWDSLRDASARNVLDAIKSSSEPPLTDKSVGWEVGGG